jgi:glutaredoxin 2
VGQAALATETIDRFLSTERTHFGLLPELSNFHCYSCHHSLKDSQWKTRNYVGRPGELRPNLSQLKIFGEALKVLDTKSGAAWGSLLETLEHNFGVEKTDDVLEQMQELLKTINALLIAAQLSESQIVQIVRNLTARLSLEDSTYYEDAEQTVLAISSLTAQSEQLSRRHKSQLDKLYKLLRDPDSFDPKTVAGLLKQTSK